MSQPIPNHGNTATHCRRRRKCRPSIFCRLVFILPASLRSSLVLSPIAGRRGKAEGRPMRVRPTSSSSSLRHDVLRKRERFMSGATKKRRPSNFLLPTFPQARDYNKNGLSNKRPRLSSCRPSSPTTTTTTTTPIPTSRTYVHNPAGTAGQKRNSPLKRERWQGRRR